MIRWNHMLLALCVAAAAGACAPDQAPDRTDVVGPPPRDDIGFEATTADPARQPAETDRQLVDEMMRRNRAEVELGQLAQERAQTGQVREFAAMMVRDHQRANVELQKMAAEALPDPAGPDRPAEDRQQARERLSQLSGAEFDREYMRLMVEQHEEAVRKVEEHAGRAENEHVRQWAETTVPTLRKHLERAREIQAAFEARPLT